MAALRDVTDASFQEIAKSPKPVVLDVFAQHCGPCKPVGAILEELAAQYGDKVEFVQLDGGVHMKTPAALGVRGFPTVMLLKGGRIVAQEVGAVPKARLEALVQKGLG